ncbi:MarR family winged helix-turn-helix transcriptional regulator [Micromonospora phytophila]|uniref:MarR family winged helix-turn-helix transcriptional regulator n=1 Tax=Micromonospora phytophila TaxID=709888 RepID=UPI00202EF981|nr:MarR family winged helix-turn-helix transcriptional regulator [Micromonospora phytophila]MCM0676893.1 MarR family winged helix-turn-helix transcriptional regulator [Micromonospora phytophila]
MVADPSPQWPTVAPLPDGHVATGLLLQMAHRRSRDRLEAALARLGIDVRSFGVLQFLLPGGLSQRQLTDLLGVDKSTLVRVIDRLEEQQLARRTRDPRDRRAFSVTITDQGRRVIASANMAAEEVGEQLFGWLSPQQRRELHQALQRIIQAADPAHPPSGSHSSVIQEPGP